MTLLVEMPAGASFAVYDAAGECVEFSWVSGRNSACLRELRSLLNIQNRMAVVIVALEQWQSGAADLRGQVSAGNQAAPPSGALRGLGKGKRKDAAT